MARTAPPSASNKTLEKYYEMLIRSQILRPMFSGLSSQLGRAGITENAWLTVIDDLFADTNMQQIPAEIVDQMLRRTERSHRRQLIASMQKAVGVNVGPMLNDVNIQQALDVSFGENISLVKSVPNRLHGQLRATVSEVYASKGFDQAALIEAVVGRFNVSNTRARTIARDQVSKTISTLNQARNTELGIEEYIWRTSKDVRVVGAPGGRFKPTPQHGNHFERDGKTFRWDTPPSDGHPGVAILCRCFARPVISNAVVKNLRTRR